MPTLELKPMTNDNTAHSIYITIPSICLRAVKLRETVRSRGIHIRRNLMAAIVILRCAVSADSEQTI